MGKLNEPRTVPYDFRVWAFDGVAWLIDNSSRTYVCSAEPLCWLEPLYWLDEECDEILPDATYFAARDIKLETLPKPYGEWDMDVTENEAWDEARESAQSNCVV